MCCVCVYLNKYLIQYLRKYSVQKIGANPSPNLTFLGSHLPGLPINLTWLTHIIYLAYPCFLPGLPINVTWLTHIILPRLPQQMQAQKEYLFYLAYPYNLLGLPTKKHLVYFRDFTPLTPSKSLSITLLICVYPSLFMKLIFQKRLYSTSKE
jgi:hypothetical protein